MSDSPDVFALAEGLRVLVTAGASGIGRAISDLLIARGARVHICDVSDDFLAEFRGAHPGSGATKADVASEADVSRLFAEVEELARRPRRSRQQRRRRRTDRRSRGDPARGLAAHDRRLPDRAIPLRASCRADAEERGRRRDRQSVLGGRTLRIRVPHPLLGRQMGGDRLHPKPRQGARPRQHPRERDPSGHCRRAAHDGRDRGAGQADRTSPTKRWRRPISIACRCAAW